jgi:hypothetical protein
MIELLITAVSLLLAICGVLCALLWQVKEEEQRQRRRAEENFCWEQKAMEELKAARQRLAAVERRHARLQELYGILVRQRLAENFLVVWRNRQHMN